MTTQTKTVMVDSMSKSKWIQVRISAIFHKRLTAIATKRGISVAALVILTLTDAYPDLTLPEPEESE